MLGYLTPGLIFQIFADGVLFGTMYGLAAIGLSLIYGTMGIIFIAQGTVIILAAYGCYFVFHLLSMDPFLSIFIIVPLSMVFGFGVYHVLFKPMASGDRIISLLLAFGFMAFFENLMLIMWTPNPRSITTRYTAQGLAFLGISISFTRLIAFVLSIISASGLSLFLKKTFIGKAVRAAAYDMEAAKLVGIKPHRVNGIAFAIGIALASVAGVAMSTTYPFDPYYGFNLSLKAMIAMALGGMGSASGAFLGGILLGVIEEFASFFVSGAWANAIAYAIFLAMLMFKPEGLFAKSYIRA
jgi:branched-chain amino acid transport system permease protein